MSQFFPSPLPPTTPYHKGKMFRCWWNLYVPHVCTLSNITTTKEGTLIVGMVCFCLLSFAVTFQRKGSSWGWLHDELVLVRNISLFRISRESFLLQEIKLLSLSWLWPSATVWSQMMIGLIVLKYAKSFCTKFLSSIFQWNMHYWLLATSIFEVID